MDIFKIISIATISIMSSLFMLKTNTTSKEPNTIIFEFSKIVKIIMIMLTILSFILTIFVLVIPLINKDYADSSTLELLIFPVLSVLMIIGLFIIYNKKIILKKDILYVYNIFGKCKEYSIKDAVRAKESYGKDIILYFKDNSKINFEFNFTNLSKLEKILNDLGIFY